MTGATSTVFVLGAGFSRRAGVPLQSEILDAVRSLDLRVPPIDVQTKYFKAYALVQEFMRHFFGLVDEPSLEDVFTFLDDAIARRHYCLGFHWQDLAEIQISLVRLVAVAFLERQSRISASDHAVYRQLAAAMRSQAGDSGAVLSLNWDCLAEGALAHRRSAAPTSGRCCPAPTPLGALSESESWESGDSNSLRVLKLHGSVDWFLCPECGRLFTGSGVSEHDLFGYAMGKTCGLCGEAVDSREAPLLIPLLVSPTYLKGIDQPRLSLIWHWAHLALRQADRVVFVGYSLPTADFAFRNLLKRSIGASAAVDVVLTETDDYRPNTPRELRQAFPAERYRRFFGTERVRLHLAGLEDYFLGK